MPLLPKKHNGHLVQKRWPEIVVALVLVLVATYLLYDAFDWRGKKMPWPASGLFWG
jgi:hypothetical protein